MSEFISRSKADAIKRTFCDLAAEQIRRVPTPEFAEELAAAAKTGGVVAVRAVLEAKRGELDEAVDRLVEAAIAEILADAD